MCRQPSANGKGRCRLHGGAIGSGAPRGERNGAYSHGRFTCEAIEERREMAALRRQLRKLITMMDD